MSKFQITYAKGATPIDPSELNDLIPDYVSTMGELNTLEQTNITDAFVWAEKQNLEDLLTASFIFELHKQMLNQVWKWAGKQRNTNKNIGVSKEAIMNDLGILLKDTEFWISHKTYSNDEIATRFHHRLVKIHIFPNGNGRHSRLMADLLLKKLGEAKFSWGINGDLSKLISEGSIRNTYINSLKKADQEEYSDLLKFVRS